MFLEPQDSVSIDSFLQQLQSKPSTPPLTDDDHENKSSDSQSSDSDDELFASAQRMDTDRQMHSPEHFPVPSADMMDPTLFLPAARRSGSADVAPQFVAEPTRRQRNKHGKYRPAQPAVKGGSSWVQKRVENTDTDDTGRCRDADDTRRCRDADDTRRCRDADDTRRCRDADDTRRCRAVKGGSSWVQKTWVENTDTDDTGRCRDADDTRRCRDADDTRRCRDADDTRRLSADDSMLLDSEDRMFGRIGSTEELPPRPASVPIPRLAASVPISTPRPLHTVGAVHGEVVAQTGLSRTLHACGAPSRMLSDSGPVSLSEPLHDVSKVGSTIEHDKQAVGSLSAPRRRLVYEYRIGRAHLYSVETEEFPPPPPVGKAAGITVSEPYSRHQFSVQPLVFESQFESGNLMRAVQVDEASYELWIQPDVNTRGNTQWYYFSVKGMQPAVNYVFRIVNFSKSSSLYNQGMRPLAFSMNRHKKDGAMWYRSGEGVCYYGNEIPRGGRRGHRAKHHYTLRFSMRFGEDCESDTVHLAYCCPYTFTELQSYMSKLRLDPARALTFKSKVLCVTLAGNECTCLSVTNKTNNPAELETRRIVVISARVHPGETCSSFMMEGVIDFLTSACSHANWLRDHFIFKLVPMMNPDGVINGNYRTSLSGDDLNRRWLQPKRNLQPEVWHLKELLRGCCEKQGVELFVDLHGHSKKKNCFMYGCSTPSTVSSSSTRVECIFPFLMSQICEDFSFENCSFKMPKSKRSTGRVVSGSQLRITKSYTMETSFLCSDGIDVHYTHDDFKKMGESLCHALYTYATIHRPKCDHLMNTGKDSNRSRPDDMSCLVPDTAADGAEDVFSQMCDTIQTLTEQTVDYESPGSCSSPSADECSEPEFDVLVCKLKKEKKKRAKKGGANKSASQQQRTELWTHLRHQKGGKTPPSSRPQTATPKKAPQQRIKLESWELKGLSSVNRFKHTVLKARGGSTVPNVTSVTPFSPVVEENSNSWVVPQLKKLWTTGSEALNVTRRHSSSVITDSAHENASSKHVSHRQRQRNQLLEVVGNRNIRQSTLKLKRYFRNSYPVPVSVSR